MTDDFTKTVRMLGELCRFGWKNILSEIMTENPAHFSHLVCHACIAHWDTTKPGITDIVKLFHKSPPSHLTVAEVVSLKAHGDLDVTPPLEDGGLLTRNQSQSAGIIVRNIKELEVELVFRWATIYFWGHPGLQGMRGKNPRFRQTWKEFFIANPSKDTLTVLDVCVLQGCFASIHASTDMMKEIVEHYESCDGPLEDEDEDEEETTPQVFH